MAIHCKYMERKTVLTLVGAPWAQLPMVQVLEGHTDEIFSCAFNYEGDFVITGRWAGGRSGWVQELRAVVGGEAAPCSCSPAQWNGEQLRQAQMPVA